MRGSSPITRLTTLAPPSPISRCRKPAASMNTSASSSTPSMTSVVSTCSTRPKRAFSVMRTAASIAPGLAIDGTASGKMAVSSASSAIFISSSGLLSPKIIVSAKRKSTIPPPTWKAGSGIPMAVRSGSPATTKKRRISAETIVARMAIARRSLAAWWRVTATKTGTVPTGSITEKKKTNVATKSIKGPTPARRP